MNKKYERYINYIADDIEAPYFENIREIYGLRPDEYPLVLSKIFNQPVTIGGDRVYNQYDDKIYHENSDGDWFKQEYDANGNEIYYEDNTGYIEDRR